MEPLSDRGSVLLVLRRNGRATEARVTKYDSFRIRDRGHDSFRTTAAASDPGASPGDEGAGIRPISTPDDATLPDGGRGRVVRLRSERSSALCSLACDGQWHRHAGPRCRSSEFPSPLARLQPCHADGGAVDRVPGRLARGSISLPRVGGYNSLLPGQSS